MPEGRDLPRQSSETLAGRIAYHELGGLGLQVLGDGMDHDRNRKLKPLEGAPVKQGLTLPGTGIPPGG